MRRARPANTGGKATTASTTVRMALSVYVNRRSARSDSRQRTSALEAVSTIMMGDSTIHAIEKAMPYAARLKAASGRRATMAVM